MGGRPREEPEEIKSLAPWFHNLHLPGGIQTAPDHPLGDFPAIKWAQIAPYLPESLQGWRALDIGCNAGFYSFELARRGARVVGIEHDPHYLEQARWAARRLNLEGEVELRKQDVYELGREGEPFDLVLFLGVFYHLRYPLLALDGVAQLTRRLLVFQSMTMPGKEACRTPEDLPLERRDAFLAPGWPKMAFLEHRLSEDPTNWWAPNHAAVEAMLRSSGFRLLGRPGHEIYLCEPDLENPSSFWRWNREEYDKATGRSRSLDRSEDERSDPP